MKLNIKIKAGKVTQEIILPVGEGTQTFKWLALAVAYRFVHDGARHGRHLPHRADRYVVPARTRLLPKDVYTSDCPFLHPDDIINQNVSNGQTITVDLYMTPELDDYGSPILSKWAFIAFRNHERHRETRERYIQEKKLEVECFQRQQEEQAILRKIEIEKPKIELMHKVMSEQMVDEEVIEATMREEWSLIKNSGILDGMVPDEEQQKEIRRFFTKYYVELSDMYKFYSAVNSGGGTHTLEYIELCKFITETGILGEEHSNAILKIFVDSHIRLGKKGKSVGTKPSIQSEIHRHEFFVALIKIAIYKNITIPKKEITKLRKKGHPVSVSKATMPTVPVALEMVYKDFLCPVLKNMPAGTKMREALGSVEVLLLFHKYLDPLSELFSLYAQDNDDSSDCEIETREIERTPDGIPRGSMTVKKFGTFANESGFLGGDEVIRRLSVLNTKTPAGSKTTVAASTRGVTQKDVRQIFSASQHDLLLNELERQEVEDDDNIDSHQEVMVFSEFLEAIARFGVLKFGGGGAVLNQETSIPDQEDMLLECIRLAIERACSVLSKKALQN